jgi:hypothetical protein
MLRVYRPKEIIHGSWTDRVLLETALPPIVERRTLNIFVRKTSSPGDVLFAYFQAPFQGAFFISFMYKAPVNQVNYY